MPFWQPWQKCWCRCWMVTSWRKQPVVLGTSSWTCCRPTCVTSTASFAAACCSSSLASCSARQVCAGQMVLLSHLFHLVCSVGIFTTLLFVCRDWSFNRERCCPCVQWWLQFLPRDQRSQGWGNWGVEIRWCSFLPGWIRRKSIAYSLFSHTGMEEHHNYQIY